MITDRHLVLYHAPNSRSTGVLTLLGELGADYELHLLNLRRGDQREPAYLAVNPMGKVPALSWMVAFKLCPEGPPVQAYTERSNARPAVQRAAARDAELAAQQQAQPSAA